jgi:hypothetical protein
MKMSQARSFCSISRSQISAAGHEPVDPEFRRAVLDRGPQIAGHKRKPLYLAVGRMLRLIGVGVANDNERFFGLGQHGSKWYSKRQLTPDLPRVHWNRQF